MGSKKVQKRTFKPLRSIFTKTCAKIAQLQLIIEQKSVIG